jgi:peptide/nickel transport system substrate-binding protein
MRGKLIWLPLVAVLLALVGVNYSSSTSTFAQPQSAKKRLVVVYRVNANLDPAYQANTPDQARMRQIFNALVRYKVGSAELEPELATNWSISADGKTYTFNLRKGVKWQKGYGELTAADVKYSIDRVMDPKTNSTYRSEYANIESVTAPDRYTVRVTFKIANATNLHKLAAQKQGYIVNAKAVTELGPAHAKTPVGTGPYMVKEYVVNDRLVLEAFPDYYEGRAKIDEIEFREIPEISVLELALKRGVVHLALQYDDPTSFKRLQAEPAVKTYVVPTTGISGFRFDVRNPVYGDIRVRRAIAHLVDKALAEKLGAPLGVAAKSHLSPRFPGMLTQGFTQYPFDRAKAKQLLTEAGFMGKELPRATPRNYGAMLDVFLVVQEELRNLGVKLELQRVDDAVRAEMEKKGEIVFGYWGWGARPDPDILLTSALSSATTSDSTHYTAIDDILAKARVEMDPTKRSKLYQDAQKKLMDDIPAIPILHITYGEVVSTRITNWKSAIFSDWRLNLIDIAARD